MGRQINFYASIADEAHFVEYVLGRAGGLILPEMDREGAFLPGVDLPPRGEPFWGLVHLWRQDISPPIKTEYIEQQGYYLLDRIHSEVVEFSRSHKGWEDDSILVRGRLYAHMGYWNEDYTEYHHKSDEFRKWYNRLAGWIRRKAVGRELGDYVLPGAEKFRAEGGRLVQAEFAKTVKIRFHDIE